MRIFSIILIVLASLSLLLSAMFRFTHWAGSEYFTIAGVVLLVIGLIILIIKNKKG